MNTIKKVGVGLVIALFLLASVYFIRNWLGSRETPIEKKMQEVESKIIEQGQEYKITELEQNGKQDGELLEKNGISTTGYMPVFGFDKIKIRYYYFAYPCFDVIQKVDELLGDYAELEHIEDVNAYAQEQKDEILRNWANHIPTEEFLGETRQFPLVLFYGSGTIEENGAKRNMEAIESGHPGFVVVTSGSQTCCEKCLMLSACQSLIKKPNVCDNYDYGIKKLPVDIEPTVPK